MEHFVTLSFNSVRGFQKLNLYDCEAAARYTPSCQVIWVPSREVTPCCKANRIAMEKVGGFAGRGLWALNHTNQMAFMLLFNVCLPLKDEVDALIAERTMFQDELWAMNEEHFGRVAWRDEGAIQ